MPWLDRELDVELAEADRVEADLGVANFGADTIVLSLVDAGGEEQGGANVDRGLWVASEQAIRAMAAKSGFTVTAGGTAGRNVRTLNEMHAFIVETSQWSG